LTAALSIHQGRSDAYQRFAGTGAYLNTQFNLEPPDQGLCVGSGFVLELVNTALAVYGANGALVAGPTPLNQFFGLRPEIVRSTPPVFGDFTSDPKCYFDPDLQRWFVTILQLDVDPGDYSAAAADESGNLWLATEFIPNAPRVPLANWGTFIMRIVP
jgi:hypothetical protein